MKLIAVLAFLIVFALPVKAQDLAVDNGFRRYTNDPSLISLNIVRRDSQSLLRHLSIPKNALVYASGYPIDDFPQWPDVMNTSGRITFAILAPEGSPAGKIVSEAVNRNGYISSVLRDHRKQMIEVDVGCCRSATAPPRYSDFVEPFHAHERAIEAVTEEGLRSVELRAPKIQKNGTLDFTTWVSTDGKITYFGDRSVDSFDVARCTNQFTNAIYYCDYHIGLDGGVSLTVKFVDFRGNGGRAFVNRYMNLALRAYCQYDLKCGWKENE
ncbi:hypothetical protein [Dongia sp.]|uniref:hypothetical protein n=1 Tax=Dongia sp. TaxID=1977262 RepID=UPI0035B33E7E